MTRRPQAAQPARTGSSSAHEPAVPAGGHASATGHDAGPAGRDDDAARDGDGARHEAADDGTRVAELVRILSQVARGDFSERPELTEDDDDVGQLQLLVRFLIDDVERAKEARDRELERLREVDRMKSQFINMAAHELSTPLTPIRMQVHYLRKRASEDAMDDRERRALDILDRNVDRVLLLVGDLLETSRIEGGHLSLSKEPVDLYPVLSRSAESFAAMAKDRGIRLRCHGDVGLVVEADAARMGQVMDNLVRNALKFTPRGGQVVLRCRRRGDEALVEVADTGLGLDADDIAALFRPFAKLTDRSPHGDVGTGLGLYICRGLVERHGGLLWCESPGKGQGATFSFVLPLHDASIA